MHRALALFSVSAVLTIVSDFAIADSFATPPCASYPGCVFFWPKAPGQQQSIDVAITGFFIPADACVRALNSTVSGDSIQVTGNYVHCFDVYFPEPPPTYLYTTLAPLAAGHYAVTVTLSPDPPGGWPYGNPGDGLFSGPVVLATTLDVFVTPPPPTNYAGLWWNAPAGSEAGWGISMAHQGNVLFATWFSYDLYGRGRWLSVTAPVVGPDIFRGTLYQTNGPGYNAVPFNPSDVTATPIGLAEFTFTDPNTATFFYDGVDGVSQTKTITREIFGPLPTCAFGSEADLTAATNYQDLWWTAPPGSEAGWGINLTHQGDTIFATWFTYDLDHNPMWLAATAPKIAQGAYSGTLYRTTGPAFNATPFNPSNVMAIVVGSATLTFSDGNHASFAYTAGGISQTKLLTREIFGSPVTICQ